MNRDKLKKYAEVVIKRGINPERGQALLIEADISASEFVYEVAEQAYKSGLGEVGFVWNDKKMERLKLKYQNDLTEILSQKALVYQSYIQKKAALLRIESPEFFLSEDVSEELWQEKAVRERALIQEYTKACGGIQNCLICVPNESWAQKVHPELLTEAAMEKLWQEVFFSLRLDEIEPIQAWNIFVEAATKRKRFFEKKDYIGFHYKSVGTNLTISPANGFEWYGGCSELQKNGIVYIPNLPTEEIFTTPDKYSASGVLASTRPLVFGGKVIDKFRLFFEKGKVVACEAEKGEQLLKQILEIDDGSSYLGEMALVDCESPISRLNTVFYNTLYDENASCHMALGAGLGDTNNSRINSSSIHIDFMIGADDLNIRGQLKNGFWEDIFVNGRWAEPFKFNI